MTEWALIIPLAIGGIIALPFLILAAFGIMYAFAYPFMLIYAVLFSGKKLNEQIADTKSREASLRDSLGRDPLTTLDGGYRSDITECGVVWPGSCSGLATGTY